MLKLANTRVASAKLELDANKDNIELQVAYQQTLNDRAGVEAQVAGFRSEQLTNEVSLNKELLETQNELRAEGLAGMERELEELQTAYDLKVEMARKAGVDITDITAQYEKEQTDIKKENANKQEAIDDAVKASKLETTKAIGGAIGALGGLMEEGTAASKTAALAEIAINTGLGIVQGLDIAQKTSKAAGPGAALAFPIFFATQVAAVLGAAAQAKTILGAGGGGGGGGNISAPPAQPAPQMMSGAFDISGGVAPEATKAYVVTDEMTNSQNQLSNIRRRATI